MYANVKKEGHASTTKNKRTNEQWRKQKRREKTVKMQNQLPFSLCQWITCMKNFNFNEFSCHEPQFKSHILIVFFFCSFFNGTIYKQNSLSNSFNRSSPALWSCGSNSPLVRMHSTVCVFIWIVFHWCLVGSAVASLPVNLLTKRTLQSRKTDSSVEWNVWFNQAVVQMYFQRVRVYVCMRVFCLFLFFITSMCT